MKVLRGVFNRSIVSMLVMVTFVGLGEKMAERFIPLYLGALGAGPVIMGALNAMDNILSALYSYPGGWISDKIGHRNALLLFTIFAAGGFLFVALVNAWWAVFAGSIFFISWTAVSLPAIMSLINSSISANRRVFGVSLHSLVRRFPMALGPMLGGAVIGWLGIIRGMRFAFTVAFLLAALSAFLMYFLVKNNQQNNDSNAIAQLRNSQRLFSPELKILLIADIFIRFCEQLPYAFLAVWVCKNLGQSEFAFGVLTAIEMFVALLVYLPVAWLADRGNKKTFVVITFIFFSIFPMSLYIADKVPIKHSYFIFGMLILAFVIRGLKEFGEPTRKSLILDLAPENAKALTFGAYYLVRDILVGIVALSAGFLWDIAPGLNFAVSTFFGILGTLIFILYGKTSNAKILNNP